MKVIEIAGGGLAGLSLGIALRERGVGGVVKMQNLFLSPSTSNHQRGHAGHRRTIGTTAIWADVS